MNRKNKFELRDYLISIARTKNVDIYNMSQKEFAKWVSETLDEKQLE